MTNTIVERNIKAREFKAAAEKIFKSNNIEYRWTIEPCAHNHGRGFVWIECDGTDMPFDVAVRRYDSGYEVTVTPEHRYDDVEDLGEEPETSKPETSENDAVDVEATTPEETPKPNTTTKTASIFGWNPATGRVEWYDAPERPKVNLKKKIDLIKRPKVNLEKPVKEAVQKAVQEAPEAPEATTEAPKPYVNPYTPKGKETREERKTRLDNIIIDGIEAARNSAGFQRYLEFCSQFHAYSFRNTMLITTQCPHASHVAGYGAWQKLGRQVRKGEKAITILAPNVYKETDEEGNEKRVVRGFRTASVFDISQTDGDAIPVVHDSLNADDAAYGALIDAVTKYISDKLNLTMSYQNLDGDIRGYYSRTDSKIVVQADMSDADTLRTMLHEVGHAVRHSTDETADIPTEQKELEAESIAFIVARALGLDTSAITYNYLATWTEEMSTDDVRAILKGIHSAATGLLKDITALLPEKLRKRINA